MIAGIIEKMRKTLATFQNNLNEQYIKILKSRLSDDAKNKQIDLLISKATTFLQNPAAAMKK